MNQVNINEEVSVDEETKLCKIENEFLHEGFFSEYLPPSFNLSCENIDIFDDNIYINQKNDYIEPYSFNMSRFSEDGRRRTIYIPELTSYIILSKYMKNQQIVRELIDISCRSKNSFSPILQETGELTRHERDYNSYRIASAIDEDSNKSTYITNVLEKIILSKGAKGILSLDISNFYNSIYTHLIPAIKLGVTVAEEQYKLSKSNNPIVSNDYKKYEHLDDLIRSMNVGRSNGLLPGILSSQFLAESLLSVVDLEISSYGIDFVRYVDDYEVFIYDEKELESIQNTMVLILRKYFLSFNNEKTKYTKFPYYIIENLEKIYSNYTGRVIESDELMKLFNTFFKMEYSGTKGAIRFLIKSLNSNLETNNLSLYITYLINVLVNDNRSLVKTCEFIIREKSKLNFKKNDVEIILRLLIQHIEKGNDLEVIWLLYLLKHIGLKRLKAELIRKIIYSGNELAIIILMEEFSSSITLKMIDECTSQAKSWLLLYQLFFHNYINKNQFINRSKITHNAPFYAILKRHGFSFYTPET